MLVEQIETDRSALENAYARAVRFEGNPKAQKLLDDVFCPADVCWRAIGTIPQRESSEERPMESVNDSVNVCK